MAHSCTQVTCRVVIKGGEHEEAVLCTSSKTYAIKYVETTNLQLLVAPAAAVRGVGCMHAVA